MNKQRDNGIIKVIHTPDHTDNNLCFRYQSTLTEKLIFLTGEHLYLDNGSWNALIIENKGEKDDSNPSSAARPEC